MQFFTSLLDVALCFCSVATTVDELQATQPEKATDSLLWCPLKHFIIRHSKSFEVHSAIDVDKKALDGRVRQPVALLLVLTVELCFLYSLGQSSSLQLSDFRAGHPKVHARKRIAKHRRFQQAAAVF